MEYGGWAGEMPYPDPNPNPSQATDQFSYHQYPTPLSSSSSYYSQNPNPVTDPTINPPGTDPCLSYSSYAQQSHHASPYEAIQASAVAYAQYGSTALPAPASSSVLVQNWSVKELVQQYGGTVPQNGSQQVVPAAANPTIWTNPAIQSRGPWKKGPKKIKIAQSQFCEVCKIVCNTKEVLDKHKTGKKHLKNLENRNAATAPAPASAAVTIKPAIGPQENPSSVSGQKQSKAPQTAENLETKRRKIMEGGAAASAVRSCAICNVVCNSETVFRYHLAGHKHASMVKKLTGGTGLATAT